MIHDEENPTEKINATDSVNQQQYLNVMINESELSIYKLSSKLKWPIVPVIDVHYVLVIN